MTDVLQSQDSAPIPVEGGKYVYCIIRSQRLRDFGGIGIGGSQRVYTVHHNDLAAVVSDTPIVIYDPTRENVLAHEFVNETVMKEHTVIPMSFGTVFRSEDDVTELLRSTYQAFSDVLDKMQDKIEFGLKVLWDRDKVVAIARAGERRDPPPQGRDQPAHEQLHLLRAHAARPARRIRAGGDESPLRRGHPRVAEVRGGREPQQQADRRSHDPERRVPRRSGAKKQLSTSGCKEISRKYEDMLTFKYSGPWPPYNFVNIKLKLEKAD